MIDVIPVGARLGAGFDFSTCRALIIEPLISERRWLRDLLVGLSLPQVEGCARTDEGWRLLETAPPTVLFIDWSDATDAIAFLSRLRSPGNPHRFLPVVVTCASSDPARVRAARDAGSSEFIVRPFSQKMVVSRLQAIAQRPRMFIQAEDFFGPDRRRRRASFEGPDRRQHQNWRGEDRRQEDGPWRGQERRQGHQGFLPLERRADRRDPPRH